MKISRDLVKKALQEILDEETTFVTDKAGKTHTTDLDQKGAQDLKTDPNITGIETAKGKKIKEDHHHNPNDDSDMAKIQLLQVADYAQELLQMIGDGQELDAWIQAKITKISDYIGTVKHYLEGEEYLDHHYEKDHPAQGDEDFYNSIPDEHQAMYEAWVKENTTILSERLGVARGELERIAGLYGPQRFTQTILAIRDENVLDDVLDAIRPLLEEGKENSPFILVSMDGAIEADSKEEFIEKMKQAGYDHTGDMSAEKDPYKDHPTMDRSWSYGLPKFKQVHGPMNNGGQFRYETLDAYDFYSLEENRELSDDEKAKIYFLQQFKQGNIDKLPQDPKVAYLQKLTKGEVSEGMGGQIDEPFFIEVSVRDAQKALDIYKDQFRGEDIEMYGSNVYASSDPEAMYDLMLTFEAQEIEVHDFEVDEDMMEGGKLDHSKVMKGVEKHMKGELEENNPGKGKRRDTPEEREGARQAGMQMTQQTHRDKSKYTRKEKHKQKFHEEVEEPTTKDLKATKGLASKKEKLAQHIKKMKDLAQEYSKAEGDRKEAIKDQLKDMTKEKRELEKQVY